MVLNKKKVLQNFFYKNFYRGTYMLSNKSWHSSARGIGLPTPQTLQ